MENSVVGASAEKSIKLQKFLCNHMRCALLISFKNQLYLVLTNSAFCCSVVLKRQKLAAPPAPSQGVGTWWLRRLVKRTEKLSQGVGCGHVNSLNIVRAPHLFQLLLAACAQEKQRTGKGKRKESSTKKGCVDRPHLHNLTGFILMKILFKVIFLGNKNFFFYGEKMQGQKMQLLRNLSVDALIKTQLQNPVVFAPLASQLDTRRTTTVKLAEFDLLIAPRLLVGHLPIYRKVKYF